MYTYIVLFKGYYVRMVYMSEKTDKRCKEHPESDVKLVLTPTTMHYGKWVCAECDKYVVHAKSPKTAEEMQRRRKEIIEFIEKHRPTGANLSFLCSVYSTAHLNLVQQGKYNKIMSSIVESDCQQA